MAKLRKIIILNGQINELNGKTTENHHFKWANQRTINVSMAMFNSELQQMTRGSPATEMILQAPGAPAAVQDIFASPKTPRPRYVRSNRGLSASAMSLWFPPVQGMKQLGNQCCQICINMSLQQVTNRNFTRQGVIPWDTEHW